MHLEGAIGSRTRVKVLRTLFQETFPRLDATSLADETGKSRSGVRNALDALVATGLVVESRRGRTSFYAIDRAHPWAQPLAELFRTERRQDNVPHLFPTYWNHLEDVAAELGREDKVVLVALFGSMTKSPIQPTADVDLFVGLAGDEAPPSFEGDVVGHEVSIVSMPLMRFADKLEKGDAFAESVAERNVLLYRDPDVEMPKPLESMGRAMEVNLRRR